MDTGAQQKVAVKDVPEEWSATVHQMDPEHFQIKEEKEEFWTRLEGEQLHLKEETDAAVFAFTAVSIKCEDDEEKPLFSPLRQQQIEDSDVPTSSSGDQMTAKTVGEGETSRNLDLNPLEQTSDSSETEMSEDEEKDDDGVNLDFELSDCGPENGDADMDWNENRSSKSDVKIVSKSFCCGKQFLSKWFLQEHARVPSHSAIRPSDGLVNKKRVRAKRHVDSCREVQTELKSFSCDDCGKSFRTKSNLSSHTSVHTGLKPFACGLCGQKFSRKTNLKSHLNVHAGQKPYACELCGQRFSRKEHLNSHMRVHTGQKPYACELCGQRFSHKTTLNRHTKAHTGQKPFSCEICGQRFSVKIYLNNHMKIHTGQKPFACTHCEKRFRRKESLKRHLLARTGQRPFACELCERQFSSKSNLNCHKKVHGEQKLFACDTVRTDA
ncbi:gastrula zinc finger protein XlCGF57.1 isoform X1 [Nothobranchius furzeri]|uniref:gastrula zinc finger protein XlCGF57.1 isoform X1 n=2 Tax=Nothobranchius furzeri TaxID=105023 RepID=UPI00077D4B7D